MKTHENFENPGTSPEIHGNPLKSTKIDETRKFLEINDNHGKSFKIYGNRENQRTLTKIEENQTKSEELQENLEHQQKSLKIKGNLSHP